MSAARTPWLALFLALGSGCAADVDAEAEASGNTQDADTSETQGDGDGDAETSGDGNGDGDAETSGDGDGDGEGETAGDGDGDAPVPAPSFFGERPLDIAHRGGRFEFPEHTLLAYTGALSVGADVLELDVHLSADDELVVIHDATVDRTTEGTGLVSELSVAELQGLDAGYAFTMDDGQSYPHRGMGLTIPTLAEVFEAFPDELYVIEIKPEDPLVTQALVAALQDHNQHANCVVSSSAEGVIEHLRSLEPAIMTGMTVAEVFAFIMVTPETEGDYEAPTPFMQVPLEYGPLQVLDPYRVELADSLGIKVHPFIINEVEQMQMLLDWGVHGIMTDRPSVLRTLIDEQP